jgi:hypothetical protein
MTCSPATVLVSTLSVTRPSRGSAPFERAS